MRKFSDKIFEEITRELAFIWSAHRVHKLDGKMRIFTPRSVKVWDNSDPGLEVWFGPGDIPAVIKKLKLFYRSAETPNSVYLLDPIVYKISPSAPPRALGSGIVWATAVCPEGEEVSDQVLERVHELGIYTSLLHRGDNQRAGIKMIGYLKQAAPSLYKGPPEEGGIIQGVQELADLVSISDASDVSRHYILSGLEYHHSTGDIQSISYQQIHGEKSFTSMADIESHAIHLRNVVAAGTCWNAYERDTWIYGLFGADLANLERNLAQKAASDEMIARICNEIDLICESNKRVGLEGKMRLYSSINQDRWRSKTEGIEFWITGDNSQEAARQIGELYNAGKLPNTPLLLDPVVYKEGAQRQMLPVGISIVYTTGISVGLEEFNPESLERIHNLGLMTGEIIRAGDEASGLKVLGFLDEAYHFSPEEIEAYKKELQDLIDSLQEEEDPLKPKIAEISIEDDEDEDEEQEDETEDGEESEDDKTSEEAAPEEKSEDNVILDVRPSPGGRELFNIINCNGTEYWHTYMLTGMEYLCTNGSFANLKMDQGLPDSKEERAKIIEQHTISLQYVLDAGKCWEAYDRMHPLWQRFGVDVKNLDHNLEYYNLCGRDFKLLNMTGESREDGDETFEFFAKGWIPKAAVTVLVATGGTGKSSLAHRLAVLASIDWRDDEPNPMFLGSEIDKENCKGLAVYLSGEDSAAIVNARAKMIDPEGRSTRLLLKCSNEFDPNPDGSEGTLADFLHYLDKLPDVAICVIDPARKYLIGDEDDAEVVGDFFEAIEEFAVKKNCAMIVVHHMTKGAKPKDSRDMLDLLRGSQVFIDRPRVVIGLYRDNAHTIAGLAKNNIPPGLGMVEGERIFVRDPERLDLFWVPGPEGVRTFTVSEEELKTIREEAQAKAKAMEEDEKSKEG